VVESFVQDYGEDLYTRIFEQGNPTGYDFYIQLKGTDDVEQYALKGKPYFSYSVDLVNLKQWYTFTLPVIFVLWDIDKKIGFWVHLQPLIDNKLKANPSWLENSRN
ncbi:MAG: DUF4365 domain-containing protein, partial [Aliifodinibius sp.]|nr:DUF4365 domain-containing protein [Fodinibius sp.]NIV15681.1 DUF4365 domain-containing protein [Fodinibius sp.]NIY29538.1 DUF4365 domain-containing protein [Fodinibius sp.]